MKDLTRRNFIAMPLAGSALAVSTLCAAERLDHPRPSREQMKIGYHLWNCSRQWDTDLDRCLRLVKETGYQGFEALLDKVRISSAQFKAQCRQTQLTCAGINGPLKDAIDFAHEAGIPCVRALVPKDQTRRWVEYAAERDVVIAVHNHIGRDGQGSGVVETRADLLRYLEERPGLKACPDTGHLLLCGDDPVQTLVDLGDRLACIHLKDVNPEAAGKGQKMKNMWFELGTGVLDVAAVMKALEKIGYTGWVVVEYGNQVDDFYQSARNMRQVLKKLGY